MPSSRWIAPPPGCVKLNVDAGVATQLCRIGCGAVIRDHLGTYMASAAVPIAGLLTPSVAEALAILHGLILCSRLGYRKVLVESDCQKVCLAMQKRSTLDADFGNVISDILKLSQSVQVVGFFFCKRDHNTIAHGLAKLALQADNSMIWWPGIPRCLYP